MPDQNTWKRELGPQHLADLPKVGPLLNFSMSSLRDLQALVLNLPPEGAFGEKLKDRLPKGSFHKRVHLDLPVPLPIPTAHPSRPECTKIAHRRSLAILTADKGIARNSAARIIFTRFHRSKNRGSLATFFAQEIAHLGASKSRDFSGSGKNRRRNRRESRDFGALSSRPLHLLPRFPQASHPLGL